MPTPSLLLLLLERLLRLLLSVLGLLPVLLRPPLDGRTPLPARSPAPVPPAHVRAATLAFLPTPTTTPPRRKTPPRPLALWERVGACPGRDGDRVFRSRPTSAVASSRPHRAPNPAKKHPAPPQEFFGKNSYCARETPISTPRHPAAHAPGRLTQPAPAPPQISRPGPHPAGSVPQPPANTPQPSKRPPKTRQSSRPREPEPPLGVRAPGGASTPQNARRNRRSTPPQTARPRPSA